jgi:hypothetical protein
MFASQVYQWPFIAGGSCAVVALALRCVALFLGLRLALKEAPQADRLPIYREFARALAMRGHRDGPRRGRQR